MRKLASIRKIDAIQPIPDADAIEVAVVGGWKVVVKKGEFQPGYLAVYCEIDSWIPHELAPFLSKGQEPREYCGVKGERLKTIRLRGQLSQGLLLPFATLRPHFEEQVFNEGVDVTELLGIQKWEAPIPAQLAGQVRGMFPSVVPKTDQERVQNLAPEVAMWTEQCTLWEVTEKLDGSSCTFYLDADGDLHVCSRNLDLLYDENNSLWKMAIKYDVREKMLIAGLKNYAIQGELIGEGIQGNPYKLKGQDFYVFDMYNVVTGAYEIPVARWALTKVLGLNHVPVIVDAKDLGVGSVEEILLWAEDKSRLNPKTEREGIVFKNVATQASFKAISNKFLVKGGN